MNNEEKEIDLAELFWLLWENKLKIIKCGAIGFVIGVIVGFSIPKVYNTTVKIAPEEIGKSAGALGGMSALAGMAGLNLNGGADGVTSMIYPDIVKSTPFLLEFAPIEVENDGIKMSFYDYVNDEQKMPWWSYIVSAPSRLIGFVVGLFSDKPEEEDIIDPFRPSVKQMSYISFLRKNISVSANKKTNILTLSVNMQDAIISATIADSLLSKLQVYMTNYKIIKVSSDLVVKQDMLIVAKQNYYDAEESFAEGLDLNRNIISQRGIIKINRLENDKNVAFDVYQQLTMQVETARIQLQDKMPFATIIEPAKVAIKALSPNKPLIAIMFAFLGGAVMAAMILYKNNFFSSINKD